MLASIVRVLGFFEERLEVDFVFLLNLLLDVLFEYSPDYIVLVRFNFNGIATV